MSIARLSIPLTVRLSHCKEEKQLDASLDDLIHRVRELKQSIQGFIYKLENDYQNISWPNMMEHFGVLSSGLSTTKRLLKAEKMPLLRNYVLFPILLSPDRDPHLEKLTEGRVLAFNHEVVPDYLRTKPEPEVEEKVQLLSVKASSITPEVAQKQLTALNKITSNILDIINASSDEWEKDSSQKNAPPQTSSAQDTAFLIGMITKGTNLRLDNSGKMQQGPPMGQMQSQQQQQQQQMQPQKPMMPGSGIGRAPSAIKTNIKAAITPHPYQRP
ncbi:mediator of RNA polymerase II transcription subunit 8-B-like isoform X2 [Physella acuta]|uniref:mediator of RNA polymerase II transcription subunit 8-B-like isoform X2 n=1 Tax=Physella acuta TaxID=109671 RepID=UPI0027DAC2A2|nr:mediator of RNA polymerase II transcription subunit 8-B-like isoform X2 [Physella acuta]